MWTKIKRKLLVDEGHLNVLGGKQYLKPGRFQSITQSEMAWILKAICQTPNANESQAIVPAVRHDGQEPLSYNCLQWLSGRSSSPELSADTSDLLVRKCMRERLSLRLQCLQEQHPSELIWLTDLFTANGYILRTSHKQCQYSWTFVKEYWISHPPAMSLTNMQAKCPPKWMKGTYFSSHSIIKTFFYYCSGTGSVNPELTWLPLNIRQYYDIILSEHWFLFISLVSKNQTIKKFKLPC